MKRIRTTLLIFSVVLAILVIRVGTCGAYKLGWSSIQHRTYESEIPSNKLAFEVTDDFDLYINDANVVVSVVLKYPNGTSVGLSSLIFYPLYNYYRSEYDIDSASWEFDPALQISEFRADITTPLVIGSYTIEVKTLDGQIHTKQINFDTLIDIPAVSSRTFQIYMDSAGNLHWTWDIPKELLTLAETYDLRIRAGVAAMVNGQLSALYWPNVPVEMGYSFLPSLTYQNLISGADNIRFSYQVRTTNNCARAYSKAIDVTDLSSPISITPQKDAQKDALFFVIPVRKK
ncbi:MAG: hypothetical protein WBN03_22700 [Desulfobacterales bacterium]